MQKTMTNVIQNRIEDIRKSIDSETVSYGEIADLQDIAHGHPEVFKGDPALAEWAGMTEQEFYNLHR